MAFVSLLTHSKNSEIHLHLDHWQFARGLNRTLKFADSNIELYSIKFLTSLMNWVAAFRRLLLEWREWAREFNRLLEKSGPEKSCCCDIFAQKF